MSNNWRKVKLGEVLESVTRQEKVEATKEYRLLGIRLDGQGPFLREVVSGTQTSATKLSRVAADDFIYSRLFAWRGAFGVIGPELDGCYVSGEFPTFLPKNGQIDVHFLRYWFRLRSTLTRVEEDCSGSTPLTRNRFKEQFFRALEIPLPPLDEQRRIVSRIEELAAKIYEARGLRQQVLEEGDALSKSSVEVVFRKLRDKFGTKTLCDVCHTITDGDHNTPQFSDSGVRFIFVGNVSSGRLHFKDSKRVSPEYFKALKRQRVPERGDILYSAVGATLGVPAIVDTDEPFCFQRHVAILKPNHKQVESQFVWYMLRSRTVFEKAWASTTGSAQPTVPLHAIRELPIPILPLSEQRQIVAELDELREEVDGLKRMQAETSTELDALMPSILDKAFRGEL
jgi:type I restriction enzyme, S subunit